MAELEKVTELFSKIIRGYEAQLKEASYQFQAAVMAAQHEMEEKVFEWQKQVDSINLEDESKG